MRDKEDICIGDFVTLIRGTTYKGELVGKPGPALLGLGSIEPGGGFRFGNYKTYGGDCHEKLMLFPGDLYVSLKGATKGGDMIGSVARVPSEVTSGRLTQDTVKLQFTRETEGRRNYLYWLLRTPQYRAYCAGRATGSAVVALSRVDFLSYPVPCMTPARCKLAELLEEFERKIELNRRMNETLEAMARAIFRDWFIDFGPTCAKAGGGVPYLHPELWALFPEQLDEEGKPEGWKSVTLSDLAKLNPESWSSRTHPSEIRYVDLSNAKWGNIDSIASYQWDEAPSRAQRVLRPGDTIVGTVRPGNGSYTLIREEGLTGSTGFAVLRPKTSRNRELVYIAATARENIERLSHIADGGAYPAVHPEIVASTEICGVSDAAISSFSEVTASFFDQVQAHENQNRTLAQTRDLLLPKLMSGEIRLREAEKMVEAVA